MQELISLFKKYTEGRHPSIEPLPFSGSSRRYYRLTFGEISLIGVYGESKEENRAFIELAKHFKSQKLNVPKVLKVSDDFHYYLQEDLGNEVLFDKIKDGRTTGVFSSEETDLLRQTIASLADFQVLGARNLDFEICYPQAEFNERSILWDLNYFKYCFLKPTGIEFNEDLLENDFEQLSQKLLEDKADTFLFRDFQSRNVILVDKEPYFIDFQGGRKGPVHYDVASFLWQAKANFSSELRNQLIDTYISSLNKYQAIDKTLFLSKLRHFVLFRTLQVLGAYGFRGNFEKKPHFMESIPFALNNLQEVLQQEFTEYPYLSKVLHEMLIKEQKLADTTIDKNEGLEVRIVSFAYKKGIPADPSGNGGGYVFDCRFINNPGRIERYKKLTGLDEPVINFLKEDGEMDNYLATVYKLVDKSVKRYINREFTSLMVSFGCTGGQHRSVYASQNLAEHISKKFGIKVSLIHREQNIQQVFERK